MFVFDDTTQKDISAYVYELYEEDQIADPNADIYELITSANPITSGQNNASVFTINVNGSYVDESGVEQKKHYYGRVRLLNTSGVYGPWTPITRTNIETELIDEQYIVSLTADRIKAGEIGSETIVLGGANPASSIIKSSLYDTSSGNQGWIIKGDGSFSLGGPNGINYNSSTGVSVGSSVTITAATGADSVSFTGLVISEGANGIAVGSTANNYWLTTGEFRTGTSTKYIKFDPSGSGTLTINGTVVQNGTVTGTIAGLNGASNKLYIGTGNYANADTAFYVDNSGNFSLKDQLYWNGSSLTLRGTINADGGTFIGYLSSGNTQVGNNINGAANYSGIRVGNTGWNNAWVERNDGTVYFRATSNQSYFYMDTYNATISLGNGNFVVDNNGNMTAYSGTFYGALSGASGSVGSNFSIGTSCSIGTSASIGGSLVIGDNVRINDATGDGGITTFKARGNGNTSGTFTARFQRLDGNYILTARNDLSVGIGTGGTYNISDQRVKINIEDSDLGLSFINSIKPRVYNLIDNYDKVLKEKADPIFSRKKRYGFIAQEIKQIADEYTEDYGGWDFDEESQIQSISYEQLISPLVKAVQELSLKVDQLESRLI